MERMPVKTAWRRTWVVAIALALVASACSGSKPATDLADRATPGPDLDTLTDDELDDELLDEDETDATDATTGTARPRTRSRATATAPVAQPGEQTTVKKDETGVPVANLFKPEEDRIGITDDEIILCMHAAFVFGDLFNNKKEDEDVYWRKINAEGGIYGRKVRMIFRDDAYNPTQAVQEAQACKQNNAFLILSGVGFDQIPAVRQWAEDNRQLYFHTMATEDGAKGKQFSFAVAPTLQTMGRQIAQYFLSKHGNKKYAVLSRNSSNWDGALDSFKAELKRRGREVVYEAKVNNGDDYNTHINTLKVDCPQNECVVFFNENVINFTKIYQQSKLQQYRPQWFNYGFQLNNDTIGREAANNPPIQAWYPTPAYDLYNETKQPWWSEIQAMKTAYDKYCTGSCNKRSDELNDVDWQFWLAFKSLHKLFLDCTADCTRNKIVGLLLNGYKVKVDPLCEANFAKGGGYFGAHQANIYQSVQHSQYGAVFKQIETCKESF